MYQAHGDGWFRGYKKHTAHGLTNYLIKYAYEEK